MKLLLARATLLAMAVLLTAATASLGDGVPAAVHYIDHDKVSATMALPTGGVLVNDPGLGMSFTRRGAGAVEYHDHTNHIIIMVEGEATLVTGGTMVDPKRTSLDQMRATSLEGGETYHLSKGDVIMIPAKTPHWWKEVPTKTVAYYAINIESQ